MGGRRLVLLILVFTLCIDV